MNNLIHNGRIFFSLSFFLLINATSNLCVAQEVGYAALYSDKFQGKKTFSGELYDKAKMTAAHKTYPIGSILKVTRLDTEKSVEVRVNDRGPYVKGRIVDLSSKAATILHLQSELGTAKVKVELVKRGGLAAPKVEKPVVENPRAKKENAKTTTERTEILQTKGGDQPQPTAKPKLFVVKGKDFKEFDLYKIQVLRPDKVGFGLQVANLEEYEGVLKQIADLQEDFFKNILVSVERGKKGKTNYKVLLGPFPDAATAASYKENAKKKKLNGFVVSLKTLKYE